MTFSNSKLLACLNLLVSRGLVFGVTRSKVATSIRKDKIIASLERKCNNLMSNVDELKGVVASLLKDKVNLS